MRGTPRYLYRPALLFFLSHGGKRRGNQAGKDAAVQTDDPPQIAYWEWSFLDLKAECISRGIFAGQRKAQMIKDLVFLRGYSRVKLL